VAATGLADFGARDAQPLEVPRRGEHPLQQLAVVRLQLLALAQDAARLDDPRREAVPDGLEAAEVEGSRLGCDRRHRDVELDARKGLRDQRRELPLEPPDLAPQLGAGEPLVAVDAKLAAGVSLEQIRHSRL
jgi:hypothetical protein